MPALIRPSEWKPVEIAGLERAAERTVRSRRNTAVIAGPGAGKTELLAQRAVYLLQTGICPAPRRILAISFKRDAANNLRERVERRCGKPLSQRFNSYTFDGFAKGLADRFRDAIPAAWRPSKDYQINPMSEREIERFLISLTPPTEIGTNLQLRGFTATQFLKEHFLNRSLSRWDSAGVNDASTWAAGEMWRYLLHESSPSRLSFMMVSRLAELLLASNAQILRALRATYSHVFLDEFQDTTQVQYDLVKAAFHGTDTVLSAVGDNKQRIMGWAGALPNSFDPFIADFDAEVFRPMINYRSAPELVRIQQYLIKALDPQGEGSISHEQDSDDAGSCSVFMYDTQENEARHLASQIHGFITAERLTPRDICVLVKMRADIYSALLVQELSALGVKARLEADVQDLLAEPLTQTLLVFFRLAVGEQVSAGWTEAFDLLNAARGEGDDERKLLSLETELLAFRRRVLTALANEVNSEESLRRLMTEMMTFIGDADFKLHHQQYRQGDFYDSTLAKFSELLWKSRETAEGWGMALDDFEGADSVPIMTIHKSKGLEYHTVIFLGLEDSAFWSFRTQDEEDKRAFFVAFSRAKKRVLFTTSDQRRTRMNYGVEQQGRQNIRALYTLLQEAGVKGFKFANKQ